MPIHWGTFNLALHAWAEPGEWTKYEAEEVGQEAAFPRPGEPFEPAGRLPVVAGGVRSNRPSVAPSPTR